MKTKRRLLMALMLVQFLMVQKQVGGQNIRGYPNAIEIKSYADVLKLVQAQKSSLLNVVGYVLLPLTNGFNLIAAQLDYDGTGTNNTANTVFGSSSLPEGTTLYRFDPVTQTYKNAVTFFTGFGWWPASGDTNDLSLNPGEGFWVELPQSPPQSWPVTIVGNVLLGNLTNPIPANYSLKASLVPQSGELQTFLEFPARPADTVLKWNLNGGHFDQFDFDGGTWTPPEPSLNVGEGFFVWRDPSQATPANWWIRTFNP